MKKYNRPVMEVTSVTVAYMLMENVSAGSIQGIHQGNVADPIEIN